MSEHTKEPWGTAGTTVVQGLLPLAECTVADRSRSLKPDQLEAERNARRIVACVNACAGIPTDQIQKDIDVGGYEDIVKCHQAHIEMVEKQRDKLLAASKSLRKAFGGAYHVPHSNEEAAALMGIDEAIAEVEAAK